MSYDADAFAAEFVTTASRFSGFRVSRVQADRVRQALDVLLQDDAGRELVLFLERNLPATEALARAGAFAVSYYPAQNVTEAEAARVGRDFALHLQKKQQELGPAAALRALSMAERQGTPSRFVELRINRECNEACTFCNTPADSLAIVTDTDSLLRALQLEREAGHEAVLFTGREPTLDERLADLVRRARELGYRRIRVQTNGTRLAAGDYLHRLLDAGVTELEISLHTLQPFTFAALVGKPALLAHTLAGVEAALAAGVRLQIVTVVTSTNLSEIPSLLRELGQRAGGRLAGVTLSPMAPVGHGRHRLPLLPRLRDLQRTLPAIDEAAAAAGIHLEIPSRCGLPLCVTPALMRERNLESQNTPGQNLESDKKKSFRCASCRFDSVCTGVWTPYLDAHGDEELQPVS